MVGRPIGLFSYQPHTAAGTSGRPTPANPTRLIQVCADTDDYEGKEDFHSMTELNFMLLAVGAVFLVFYLLRRRTRVVTTQFSTPAGGDKEASGATGDDRT